MLLIFCVKIGVTFFLPDDVALTPLEGDVRAFRVETGETGVLGEDGFKEGLVNELLCFALSGVTELGDEPLGNADPPFPKDMPLKDELNDDLDNSEINLDDEGPERDALRVSTRGDADFANLEEGLALESRDTRLLGGVENDVLLVGLPKLCRRLDGLELEGELSSAWSPSVCRASAAGEDDLRKLR